MHGPGLHVFHQSEKTIFETRRKPISLEHTSCLEGLLQGPG